MNAILGVSMALLLGMGVLPATAQQSTPNLILSVSDDTGYGDLGPYVKYPPRKLQSEVYTGPITLTQYQRLQWVREKLERDGITIPLPTGN